MPSILSLPVAATLLASTAVAQVYLSPDNIINLPASDTATSPLTWLGGNGPYFAGPNVSGVDTSIPEGCYVDQAFSISRHGSRYPDTGAYNGWVDLYNRIQAANFTATGELAFLKSWKPVLTHPEIQIARQSPTGWKEALDLGYKLRTKYPDLYEAGTKFYSWANLYSNNRVYATARNFVRGFLGENADELGVVVTVDGRAGVSSLFNSLAPSDQCPTYRDASGGDYATEWDSIYLPPITARFNALLSGNLVLTPSDISSFPYLCGFESQITGILSPFCSTFNDAELRGYQYRQDLRYYYGTGPGTDLPSKMMLPFLNSVLDLFVGEVGKKGIDAEGKEFEIPRLLTAFANDGQMTQLVAALGVFDDQTPLSGSEIPEVWRYVTSRFATMRGTVAFERFTCKADSSAPNGTATTLTTVTTSPTTASLCSVTPATTTAKACNRDNCFRQLLQNSAAVGDFCGSYTTAVNSASTALPTFVSQCQGSASRISSACSCLHPATATPCPTSSSTTSPTSTPTPTISPGNGNKTYIRILLNDAVYPLPSCQDGPGKTCEVEKYKRYVEEKLEDAGDLVARCNVTLAGAPETKDLKGAGFFRDLRGEGIAFVKA